MLGPEDAAHVSMPGVHRVASLVKRWILGTHQGSVQPDQLDFYLDEFVFRFNRRASRSRGILLYRQWSRLYARLLSLTPMSLGNGDSTSASGASRTALVFVQSSTRSNTV